MRLNVTHNYCIHFHLTLPFMKRWFFKKYLYSFISNDKIIIGGNKGYAFFQNTKEITQLFELLKTTGVLEFSEMINSKIFKQLMQREFLTTKIEEGGASMIRTLLFMNTLDICSDEYKSILEKQILILGAGTGSIVAFMLCQLGFKKIAIVDYDVVEDSDLYKNSIYRIEDIGSKKVVAVKNILKHNFDISINAYDVNLRNEAELIDIIDNIKPSLLISAIDPDPYYRFIINKILFAKSIVGIFASYSYSHISVGPTIEPGRTNCYESLYEIYKVNSDGVYDLKSMKKAEGSFFLHPSINFGINMTASIIIKETIFILLKKLDYVLSYGAIVRINTLDMSGDITPIECNSDCKICKI